MREAREELSGWLWVTLGGLASVLIPLWLMITAVIIQLSPELGGLERISDAGGLGEEVRSVSLSTWLVGAREAGRLLALALPLVGVFGGGGWLVAVANRRRGLVQRVDLDAEVADDVVMDGVELKVSASTSFDPRDSEEEITAAAPTPGVRLLASGLDLGLAALASAPAIAVAWSVSRATEEASVSGAATAVVVVSLAVLLSLALVQIWGLTRTGQTLGKRLAGLKIVRSDGSEAGFTRAFLLRYAAFGLLCAVVPVLGWLVAPLIDGILLFEQSGRTLHDLLADTQVVNA